MDVKKETADVSRSFLVSLGSPANFLSKVIFCEVVLGVLCLVTWNWRKNESGVG